MTDQMQYKPAQIAEIFDVSPNTVRNWARWHGEYLDDSATPGPGATRLFSGRDMQVLKAINQLRSQGLTTDEINARLAVMTFPIVEPIAEQIESDFSPPAARESVESALLPVLREAVDQKQRIDALEARISEIEHRSSEWKALAIVLGLFALGTFLLLIYVFT